MRIPKKILMAVIAGILLLGSSAIWRNWTGPQPQMVEVTHPRLAAEIKRGALPVRKVESAPEPKYLISDIVETKKATTFPERLRAVHALGNNLTPAQIQELYAFLMGNVLPDGLRPLHVEALKNDVLSLLRNQTQPPSGLTDLMLSLYQDKSQDPVVRIYALQHLALWHDETGQMEQIKIQQLLWNSLQEKEGAVAGTSLIALQKLAQNHPEVSSLRIRQSALALAADENAGESSRITALQICSSKDSKKAVPIARNLAGSKASIPLRISAIAALGNSGSPEAKMFLRQLSKYPEPRLQPAIQSSLARLEKTSQRVKS